MLKHMIIIYLNSFGELTTLVKSHLDKDLKIPK